MRSTLEEDREAYYRGFDDMAAYLRSAQGQALLELLKRKPDRQAVLDDYHEAAKADWQAPGRTSDDRRIYR
jgi:hypothetical protein